MSEKQVLRWLETEAAHIVVPHTENVRIAHMGIGVHRELTSHLTGSGGSATHSHDYYDFGIGIENQSATSIKVQFVLGEQDGDGYLTKKTPVSSDVGSGEKQRVWANLRMEDRARFAAVVILEISVSAPSELLDLGNSFGLTTYPNRSIADTFQLATNRLPFRLPQQYVVPLVVTAIVIMIFIYLSI
jgi:hypothetical protein